MQLKLWEKYIEEGKMTVLHRPSKYKPLSVTTNEIIPICNPFLHGNSAFSVRFNKHIYEVLYHYTKNKELVYNYFQLTEF